MTRDLKHLFKNNREWAKSVVKNDPKFFSKLSHLQSPRYLWIGCSDSRVPANEITGLLPGELFVHRNVANVVVHSDLNCLSVVQYAVSVLKVKDIIVCGHYGCGGIKASLESKQLGLIDNWLKHVQDVSQKHSHQMTNLNSFDQKFNRLCELNVIEQALNICQTTIIREAWKRKQGINVHAWIYDLRDGLLKDLGFVVSSTKEILPVYQKVLKAL